MTFKLTRFMGVMVVLAIVTAPSFAGIAGTPHDLSGVYGATEKCIFCHTPHNANATPLAPLWNHMSTAATYTLYTSPTLNAADMGQPNASSKACLSCHDGTVAIDAYGTKTTGTKMTGPALVGTDLGNDHPVSFTYNAALATADGGLVSPASASLVVTGVPLFDGQVQCASCHAVHDNTVGNFLRLSNAGSALCLKCHLK